MGAQLWYHEAPWQPDVRTALKALQARFLVENYDLTALLPRELANARESVASAREEGDPYGLVAIYLEKVELLERLCSQPVPEEAEARIEIVRQINADRGEGIGNVLDVTHISEQREPQAVQHLKDREIERLVGMTCPSLAQACQAIDTINDELGRGEAVCFPFYDNGTPVGWYFVGNTID